MSNDQVDKVIEFKSEFDLNGIHYLQIPGSPVGAKSDSQAVVKIGNDIQLVGFVGPDDQIFVRLYHVPTGVFAWYRVVRTEPHEKS
ncbi:MAG: hypothetical protein JWO40_216 [Candidatus Doudnabacteria bacterium]|nr:hypothetical protein [Candidatus Doudnabacteria bacterium]